MASQMENDVEKLLRAFLERKSEIEKLEKEKDELLVNLDSLAGSPEATTGTLNLEGITLSAKLVRRENVSYTDKDKLALIIEKHREKLKEFFKFEIKESGQKVEKFLASGQDPDIIAQLEGIRKVSQGKTQITVLAKKAVI